MKFPLNGLKDAYFLKAIVVSNFRRLTFPFKFSYAVTYRCNLRCSMCYIWKKSHCRDELDINEIDNFFRKSNRFSWVGITGGEPFLRPDLLDIIDIIMTHCKRLNAIHFATNAQLKERILEAIDKIKSRDKKVKIVFSLSIDGPAELHDKIRGVSGTWGRAVDTLTALKKIKSVKPQINFTVSANNTGRFKDTFLSLKTAYPPLRFDDITVNIFQKSGFYYDNEEMPDLEADRLKEEILNIQKMDKGGLSINNFLRRRYLGLYGRYLATKKCPLKCQALSSTCFLDAYGDLFPCAVYNKKLINVRDMKEDLAVLWNSEYARNLSYECSHHICPGCWSPCDAYSAILGSLTYDSEPALKGNFNK